MRANDIITHSKFNHVTKQWDAGVIILYNKSHVLVL